MPSTTDLLAVFICTVTPAASVLLLIALVLVENFLVRLLRGSKKTLSSAATNCNDSSQTETPICSASSLTETMRNASSATFLTAVSSGRIRIPTRQKVRAVLEAILQFSSIAILMKMASLLVEEMYEMISEAQERDDGVYFVPTVTCLAIGGVLALIIVHFAEGGGDDGKKEDSSGDAVDPSAASLSSNGSMNSLMPSVTAVKGSKADAASSSSSDHSSRGVILAMLIHTCAEGLAAGIVMASKHATDNINNADALTSMLDITSAYFISLALHNVSEGLVVATAVRTEVQSAEEKEEAAKQQLSINGRSSKSSAGSSNDSDAAATKEKIRCKSKRWIMPAILKTSFSHIGQPIGLLAVLFAPQLGLDNLTSDGMPLFVAFIQGVSFGSIGAAILFEALPEVGDAFKALWTVFVVAGRSGGNESASAGGQKLKFD